MSSKHTYHFLYLGTLLAGGVLCFIVPFVPADAGTIKGSKHDLTSLDQRAGTGVMVGVVFNDYGSACVYCHIPHSPAQNTRGGTAPLWNREFPASTYKPYQSATLDSKSRQPSGVSLACLSCHDGTVAVDRLLKTTAHTEHTKQASMHLKMSRKGNEGNCAQCHRGGNKKIPEIHDIGVAAFGQNLSDDHPVSINYPLERQDAQFHPRPKNDVFANGVRLYSGRVECASCHDVHNPDTTPFLRNSVKGSALCMTCHKK